MESSIYDYKAETISGEEILMKEFEGKVLLIVNTASKCGFTPQYSGLEKLYQDYKDKGFVVLGFPCNQFGKQEPGNENEIKEFCRVNYDITFPMFKKIQVNGENTHPLYTFLKSKLSGIFGSNIKWNFTKFLINSRGEPIKRFSPATPPSKLRKHIEKLLN